MLIAIAIIVSMNLFFNVATVYRDHAMFKELVKWILLSGIKQPEQLKAALDALKEKE